mmetsp:Transcript_20894/g.34444  ORF Transcript_20894/g.34444 Transcript_20894/m.34444 type:complete len:140 (+) Transcript_20894:92-511(+)
MASMFSGITSQITNLVAKGKGEGEVDENGQPIAPPAENGAPAVGEDGQPLEGEAAGAGGVSGLAQGLMAKAMSAKDGIKEKAAGFQPPNLQGLGGNLMASVNNLIPGRREEDVPTPPEPNPPSEMGGEMIEGEEQMAAE